MLNVNVKWEEENGELKMLASKFFSLEQVFTSIAQVALKFFIKVIRGETECVHPPTSPPTIRTRS